jgi:hypothetical protein
MQLLGTEPDHYAGFGEMSIPCVLLPTDLMGWIAAAAGCRHNQARGVVRVRLPEVAITVRINSGRIGRHIVVAGNPVVDAVRRA